MKTQKSKFVARPTQAGDLVGSWLPHSPVEGQDKPREAPRTVGTINVQTHTLGGPHLTFPNGRPFCLLERVPEE